MRVLVQGEPVYDWITRDKVGIIHAPVRERGKIVAYEVKYLDGPIVEHPIEQFDLSTGDILLLPSWVLEAKEVISQMKKGGNVQELMDKALKTIRKLEEARSKLLARKEEERRQYMRLLADRELGSISEQYFRIQLQKLRELREITDSQLKLLDELVEELDRRLTYLKLSYMTV